MPTDDKAGHRPVPRVRLSPPFDAFHGTVASPAGAGKLTTYSSAIAAQTARRWVKPTITATALQQAIQGYATAASKHYSSMSAANVALHNAAALLFTRSNILGLDYKLTGNGLHRIHNFYRQVFGYALASSLGDYLTPSAVYSIDSCVFTASPDGGITPDKITVSATVNLVPDIVGGLIRVSLPLAGAARQANAFECTLMDPVIANNGTHRITSPDPMVFNVNCAGSGIGIGSRVGLHITPMNASHYPGPVFFARNFAVT